MLVAQLAREIAVSGRSAPWLSDIKRFSRCIWLNPLPRDRWEQGARAIAQSIPMVHSTTEGLAEILASVPRRPSIDPARTLPPVVMRPYPVSLSMHCRFTSAQHSPGSRPALLLEIRIPRWPRGSARSVSRL